ncbi:MAG: OprO/OprP family phosphate-selective porin [Burkholderiales bacterium]
MVAPHFPLPRFRSAWRMGVCCCVILAMFSNPCLADTVELISGEKLIGTVVSESDATIEFESTGLGKVSLPRDRILRIEKGTAVSAPVPGAQEVVAPVVPLGEEVAQIAAPPEPPKKDEDLLRMYWDQGLRYQIFQPITVQVPFSQDERTIGEEIRIIGRAGLKWSQDVAAFHSNDEDPRQIEGGGALRQFKLYTNGQVGKSKDPTLYSLDFGSVDGSFYMTEGWVRWQGVEYVHNLQIGYETVPQTLENIYSFTAMTFMEASSMSLAFSPGNRLGVEVFRFFDNESLRVSGGVYSVGSDLGLNGGSVTQTLLYPVVRATRLPVFEDRGKDGIKLAHFGISVGYQLAKDSEFLFQARPESFIAPYLVNTGKINADKAGLVGLEALYMHGPFTLTGEMAGIHLKGENPSNNFWGGYVSVGYFLTGEQREYDKSSGAVVGRLLPKKEFSWKAKTGGAWEVAARISYLDLEDQSVNGGRMGIGMLGVNWYWDRYLRWQLNTAYADVREGPSPGDLYFIQARFQVVF